MPLSRNIIDKENARTVAINYKPKTIESQLSEQALEYVSDKEKRGDFRVDKIVAEYTGIEELEKLSQQREIAQEALKLSQEVQEQAYEEAYKRGLEEGKAKAYAEEKERVEAELVQIRNIIGEIKHLKTDIMKDNEKHIVNLCLYLAKRLLMKEVNESDEYIKSIIKRALEMAQSEEEVTIRMSSADYQWVSEHKESIFKEMYLDESTKMEEDPNMSRGGVIIETNHGVIDATLEQRVDKLESLLKGEKG